MPSLASRRSKQLGTVSPERLLGAARSGEQFFLLRGGGFETLCRPFGESSAEDFPVVGVLVLACFALGGEMSAAQ